MKISTMLFIKMSLIIAILSIFFIQCKKEIIPEPVQEEVQPNPLAFTQAEIDTIFKADSLVVMRIMNIFLHPDSAILRTPSKNVIIGDTSIKRLTDRMYTSVKSIGVGIAAPQVGINRNIIWVQRYDKLSPVYHPFEVYLNPRITTYCDTVVRRADGCLSVPQSVEYPNVIDSSYRAKWVDVEYYLPNGTFVQERISQWYTAHIFQHEIDHLNGIMFFDNYVSKNKHLFTIEPIKPEENNIIFEQNIGK